MTESMISITAINSISISLGGQEVARNFPADALRDCTCSIDRNHHIRGCTVALQIGTIGNREMRIGANVS